MTKPIGQIYFLFVGLGRETKQRILESARDLIYARSYAEVGVAAICESAGVKKGSFYHFFPSKLELTLEVIDALLNEFKQKIFTQAFHPSLPPLKRFQRLGELVYRMQKEIADATGHTLGCPFGNIALEMSTQSEALRRKVEGIFSQTEGLFWTTLSEAVTRGDIDVDLDIDSTAGAMVAYLEGLMLMAKTCNDPEVIRTLIPALADIRLARS